MGSQFNYKMAYVRAFAVVAVILAHADLSGLYTLPVIDGALRFFSPFSFMIPVFFFVSGYFFISTSEIWGYVKKRFRRLVVPYYFWNLFYAVVFLVFTSAGLMQMSGAVDLGSFFVQPWVTGEQYIFNLAMWFVLTLFLVQIAYVAVRQAFARIKRLNEYILFAVCLALGVLGTYLSTVGWNDSIYLVISRMLFGLPFVAFGYLYKVKLEKYDAATAVNIVMGAVLLLLTQYSLLQFYGSLDYDSLHVAFQGRLLQPFLSSFTGIWLCLQLSKVSAWVFSPKTQVSRSLKYIGDKSWDIMVHQFLGFWLLSATFLYFGAGGFNFAAFRTDIYYRYSFGGVAATEVLYVLVGLVFPLVFSYVLSKTWGGLQAAFKSAWSGLK
jgi:fucose 4-O-acetylase-like acetyltransferase